MYDKRKKNLDIKKEYLSGSSSNLSEEEENEQKIKKRMIIMKFSIIYLFLFYVMNLIKLI